MHIRIGTRGSSLAIVQTDLFIKAVKQFVDPNFSHFKAGKCANLTYEVVPITTSGDKIQDRPLYDIGGKALFLKELEEALIDGRIDCAVHSLKDVPATLPEALKIGAVLEREDPRDALITGLCDNILDLPFNAKIGTSSVRRRAQLLHSRKDLQIIPIRGNVQTRIEKWKSENLDGIVIAMAGIKRLGLYDPSTCHIVDVNQMVPSVGQGAICVEVKSGDKLMDEICARINHEESWITTQAERGFLEYLNGDCRTPMGAYAKLISENEIEAKYMLAGNNLEYYRTITLRSPKIRAYNLGVQGAMSLK
ncbi:MAG: hydroxymethylbilane synthase [Rickettsiaceae bacterium]|nr:hydroxymethylbilane synthase [Rickettsiaceae bacterium]